MSSANAPAEDFTVTLHDGRAIGVATVGTPDGRPIVNCHGSGSSRLEVTVLSSVTTERYLARYAS